MVFVGISFYVGVLGSVKDFYGQHIKADVVTVASHVFNELDEQYMELVQDGTAEDSGTVRLKQVELFRHMEQEAREGHFNILIYSSQRKVVFTSELIQDIKLQDVIATLEKHETDQKIRINDENYYTCASYFSPWEWHIILFKTDAEYKSLATKLQQVYWRTFFVLFATTIIFLIILIYQLKKPVQAIIKSVKGDRAPNYHGIYEFEYMSDAIRSMMESLKISDERHRDIFNDDHDTILIYSLDGELLEFNRTSLHMFNISEEDIEHCSFAKDLSSEKNLEKFDSRWQEVLRGRPQQFDWVATQYGGGRDFYIQINLKKTTWGGEDIILFTVRNIDDRVKMAGALADSRVDLLQQEKAFETLFEESADAVLLVEDGVFTKCNEAALAMYGYGSKDGLLHSQPFELSPDYQPCGALSQVKADAMMQLVMSKGSHHFEWVHTRQNGEVFWADLVLTNLMFGQKSMIHGVVRDISAQKNMEEDILKERDIANQANLSKSEFLANMSHELRTPMHGILSYAHMGVNRWEKASRTKLLRYFQTIEHSGSSLMALLNDLLDLSRLDAEKMVYSMASTDITKKINMTRQEYLSMASDKGVELTFTGHDLSVFAWCDGDRLTQVLRNIIANAIKFSDSGGEIKIGLDEVVEDDVLYVQVNIADAGVGIPEDELGAIFDTFIQSSKTSTGAGGTGLGLAISKKIIADHGGGIWASNNADGGACFSFTLPVEDSRLKVQGTR